jgi:hypothetical protein
MSEKESSLYSVSFPLRIFIFTSHTANSKGRFHCFKICFYLNVYLFGKVCYVPSFASNKLKRAFIEFSIKFKIIILHNFRSEKM